MTATNVTPVSPVGLPYTYTDNFGTAYQFASVSQQGCVDTVYPLTANAGGTFNVKGVPLTASEGLVIIQDANHQFGPAFLACQSLLNQVTPSAGAGALGGLNLDVMPSLGLGNWLFDDGAVLGIFVIGVALFEVILEKIKDFGKK